MFSSYLGDNRQPENAIRRGTFLLLYHCEMAGKDIKHKYRSHQQKHARKHLYKYNLDENLLLLLLRTEFICHALSACPFLARAVNLKSLLLLLVSDINKSKDSLHIDIGHVSVLSSISLYRDARSVCLRLSPAISSSDAP